MANSSRWYMTLVLDSLHTTTSGEALGLEGEWYFKVNGNRWPTKGHVKLSKNETFSPPDPKPHLWSAVLTKESDPVKLDIYVKEEDIIKDDTMLEGQITAFFESKDKIIELKSKDGRVTLKVRLIVTPAPNW